ncbi:MAG TPA: hypothetical protein VMN03_11685, partial [Burkholderiales bacterium]|nr:hypothetical protein [Burkholderiales bacterium]
VFLASWWGGPPVCRWALRAWNAGLSPAQARWLAYEPGISTKAAGAGAFIGAYSHVAIDSIMHGDMEPFAPFTAASPWLHAVQLETLHLACVAAGLIGVTGLFVIRWLELKRSSAGGK